MYDFLIGNGLHIDFTLPMKEQGPRNWAQIAGPIKGRTGKSCRLRWFNQLDPSLKKAAFCQWEDAVIISAHKVCSSSQKS